MIIYTVLLILKLIEKKYINHLSGCLCACEVLGWQSRPPGRLLPEEGAELDLEVAPTKSETAKRNN